MELDLTNDELRTLSSCLNSLRKRDFKEDFIIENGRLKCIGTGETFAPSEVRIVNYYRFEGESDPADMAILYAIETKNGLKGSLVDAFGPYASRRFSDFIIQIKEIHKKTNVDTDRLV